MGQLVAESGWCDEGIGWGPQSPSLVSLVAIMRVSRQDRSGVAQSGNAGSGQVALWLLLERVPGSESCSGESGRL